MWRTALALSLLVACSTLADPGSNAHVAASPDQPVPGSPEILWHEVVDAYRTLGIPIAGEHRDSWSVISGDVVPFERRIFGANPPEYVRCPGDIRASAVATTPPSVTISTTLVEEGGMTRIRSRVSAFIARIRADGRVVQQPCVSTGTLEALVLRTVQRRR